MVRSSTQLRSLARKGGLGTRLALAAALAGGMLLGSTALSAPAYAQGKKDSKPGNTKAFAEAYGPVAALANAEGADYASAKTQLPAVMAAIGMFSAYCGTLMTPMAANFNIIPAALLELPDKYGVIKAQVPTALGILFANIVLLYFLMNH